MHGPFRLAADSARVREVRLAMRLNRSPQRCEVREHAGGHVEARCIQRRARESRSQPVRQHGLDSRQRLRRGLREPGVRPARNNSRAEHHRLDLRFGEHQRR